MSGIITYKNFKKQHVAKATASELKKVQLVEDPLQPSGSKTMKMGGATSLLHNQSFAVSSTVWFDPCMDPTKVQMKKPERSSISSTSFMLFAAHPENAAHIILPLSTANIRTGFSLNAGLHEEKGMFGDTPNWVCTIHGLKDLESAGLLTGTAIIESHFHEEITVTLFNISREMISIVPTAGIAHLVFQACHVPDIAPDESLVKRYFGMLFEKIFFI